MTMILVRHVMSEAPKTLNPQRSVADAAGLMEQYDVGVIPLAGDDETLVGLITDRDMVLRVLARQRDPREVTLGEIATTNLVTVTPDSNIAEARDLMSEHKIRRLPVTKEGRLVGIVSLGDIAVSDTSKRAVGDVLSEVSESPSTTEMSEGPERGTPDRVRENDDPRREAGRAVS
jgi:CBS domain-containing protein